MSRAEGNPKPQYASVPAENKTAAYSKTYYEKNKEQRRADGKVRSAKYRKEHREEARKRAHDHWHSKSQEERSKICNERRLSQRFKRTPEWYNETLAIQGGHCALCPTVPGERRFHVDHDHNCCPGHVTCGKCNRGILCANCNRRLGFLEETTRDIGIWQSLREIVCHGTWTEKALQYLKQYTA